MERRGQNNIGTGADVRGPLRRRRVRTVTHERQTIRDSDPVAAHHPAGWKIGFGRNGSVHTCDRIRWDVGSSTGVASGTRTTRESPFTSVIRPTLRSNTPSLVTSLLASTARWMDAILTLPRRSSLRLERSGNHAMNRRSPWRDCQMDATLGDPGYGQRYVDEELRVTNMRCSKRRAVSANLLSDHVSH